MSGLWARSSTAGRDEILELRRLANVHPTPSNPEPADEESMAPTSVQPAGKKDASERPIVNPVTGAPQ